MDVKRQIKAWERDFESKHGKKPSAGDIKSDAEIYTLYRQYQSRKKRPKAVETPHERDPQVAPENGLEGEPEAENEPESPKSPEVTEVFPTPQMGGRFLGIFDLKIPQTPSRSPSRRARATPQKQLLINTPTSRRTPTYLKQRHDETSPFPKRQRRYKSISELAKDAHLNSDDEVPTLSLAEIAQFSLVKEAPKDTDYAKDTTPEPAEPRERKLGKGPKIKKRRVIRPVLPTDVPDTSKAGANYKRLGIQKRKIPSR